MEVNQLKNEAQHQISLQKNKEIGERAEPSNMAQQASAYTALSSTTVQISDAGIASFEDNHLSNCGACQEKYATLQTQSSANNNNNLKTNENAKAILEEARKRITGDANQNLSKEELAELRELQTRDREVRTHEQAHLAAAGNMAKGGAKFTFKTGPDGQQYATSGEVSISMSEGRTPHETMARARTIRAAAMAPASPSSQDRSVAAHAAAMESKAQAELIKMAQEVKNVLKNNSAQPKRDTHEEQTSEETDSTENTSSPQAIQAYQNVQSVI